MSKRTGRSWYRLSSIVRPTPYSSRDPSSPHYVIEPPLSPTASPSPPPPTRSPPKEVREAKPSPRHEHETTGQKTLTFSDKTNIVHGPNKEQQQQDDDELSPAAQPSHPPPQLMSPTLRPPSPEEVQDQAKPTPVTSLLSINHEPPKPRQEHETTHQKNILTLSEKTDVVRGPNKTLFPESDGDVITDTQSVITISGDNKGAVMEILRSPSKTPYLFMNDAKKSAEKKSKSKNHSYNGENRFVNSNVQMINGSVVYNSSETHHDPGIHLSSYRKPSSGIGFITKDHGNGYNSSIS